MVYFHLMKEGEEKEDKREREREKNRCGEGGFHWGAGPALLAVPWVIAVRYK
jgi:hypothetical protein